MKNSNERSVMLTQNINTSAVLQSKARMDERRDLAEFFLLCAVAFISIAVILPKTCKSIASCHLGIRNTINTDAFVWAT
jgi:hypothetical protein